MSFRKIKTIQVSERVFDIVCDHLDTEASEYDVKISGYLECFNNCREQGYVLHVSSSDFNNKNRTKDDLCIWVHEHRNGDSIVVRWQTEYPHNGMFNEETYTTRTKCFHYNQLQEAADFIVELVKAHFAEEFR